MWPNIASGITAHGASNFGHWRTRLIESSFCFLFQFIFNQWIRWLVQRLVWTFGNWIQLQQLLHSRLKLQLQLRIQFVYDVLYVIVDLIIHVKSDFRSSYLARARPPAAEICCAGPSQKRTRWATSVSRLCHAASSTAPKTWGWTILSLCE